MIVVVADTSPLNYLVRLGHIEILHSLYGQLLIPDAVHRELLDPRAPEVVLRWAQNLPQWVQRTSPSTFPIPSIPRLQRGETEAILLAKELSAHRLLMDEAAGRAEATRRGLQTTGTLGILLDAHRLGLLNFRDALAELEGCGFYLNSAIRKRLLDSL